MSTTTVERYAGVDVSKARLDVAVRPTGERYSVANDPEGIDKLVGGLEEEGPPKLVVLEATGGFERPAAMALAASGIPVAVVNPRKARDFSKATGTLAKTDKIDAYVLARFAEALKPEPRALPDQQALLLSEILDRRRQLIGMLVAENNRLSATVSAPVTKRIRAHVGWLEKELSRTDRELEEVIETSPAWRESETLSCAASPVSALPSQGRLWPSSLRWGPSPTSVSPLWWGSPPSTATPARQGVSGRCGAAGRG